MKIQIQNTIDYFLTNKHLKESEMEIENNELKEALNIISKNIDNIKSFTVSNYNWLEIRILKKS